MYGNRTMKLFSANNIAVATIWAESRGEPREGKMAVGEVIRRRTLIPYNSDGTIIGTCCRDRQFSSWNNDDPQRLWMLRLDDTDPIVIDCKNAWEQSEFTDYSNGAVLYHANWLKPIPYWAPKCRVVAKIGAHIFYLEDKGT
jgi:N-acetylmuramoyl-L-alanine amidase